MHDHKQTCMRTNNTEIDIGKEVLLIFRFRLPKGRSEIDTALD